MVETSEQLDNHDKNADGYRMSGSDSKNLTHCIASVEASGMLKDSHAIDTMPTLAMPKHNNLTISDFIFFPLATP